MEKLEQLRKAEQEASNNFMYGGLGTLQELYAKEKQARKELREYEQLYFKGSGVLEN